MGIEESEDDTILLGQQTLRNTFVEYDLENNRVGMVVAECEKLRKKFAPDTPHNPWKFVATVFILLFTACHWQCIVLFVCQVLVTKAVQVPSVCR